MPWRSGNPGARNEHWCSFCANHIRPRTRYYTPGRGAFGGGPIHCAFCVTSALLTLRIDRFPVDEYTHWDHEHKQPTSLTDNRPDTLTPRQYALTAVVIKDPSVSAVNHLAYCPALPGCHAMGHTAADALARLHTAIYHRIILDAHDHTFSRIPTEISRQTIHVTVPENTSPHT